MMDLHRHTGLIGCLAAEHAPGVLRGQARRRLENLTRNDAAIRFSIQT